MGCPRPMVSPSPTSAQDLVRSGVRPRSPRELLREAVLLKYNDARKKGHSEGEALQSLYPNTILDTGVLNAVTAAVVSGANLLSLAPPGSGKTSLAKDVWDLYPKEVIAVRDCPVQDDPFSVVDEGYHHLVPACPHC